MKHKDKQYIYFSSALLAIIIICLFLVYAVNLSDPFSRFLKKGFPAAFVGLSTISVNYWDEAHTLALKLDSNAVYEKISAQQVKIKKEARLINSLKIKPSGLDYNNELKFYKTGKTTEYNQILNKYFSSDENLFGEYVVKPQLYDALLKIKYNQDFIANSVAYNKAKDILAQIDSGKVFEDIAKAESDDKITGQIGGDLGFVKSGQILPELEKVIISAPVGKVYNSIVVTRLGYHIIYPVETAEKDGQKVWHVKHILITTTGFDNWLDSNLNKFMVWQLLR